MLQLNSIPLIRKPANSPFVSFASGTKERTELLRELDYIRRPKTTREIEWLPLWINGPVYVKDDRGSCVAPHNFKSILATYSKAKEANVNDAITTVLNAKKKWMSIPWQFRLSIFQTAARLLETKYLYKMVAAVMEDYSKTPYEAFIDVQELIDFWNFNCYFASEIYSEQPDSNADTINMTDNRPLEGFVYAVPPNNFAAIEGNLPTAPLIMGNVVIAKPSSDVIYSFHLILKILLEAGLPKNVMAVLHGNSGMISDIVLGHKMLSGIHFTGGTDVFKDLRWKVAQNEFKGRYKNFVRIVGETGGKNAIVTYANHDPIKTAASVITGAFGYQGQKCSATSRIYATDKVWSRVKEPLFDLIKTIKVGDPADFRNFMGSIINVAARDKINSYIEQARTDRANGKVEEVHSFDEAMGVCGGAGHYVVPTIIVTRDPYYRTMQEEIFGPVPTVCILPEQNYEKRVLELCDKTSPFGLTGAIHTDDIYQFCEALDALRYTAGNMYNAKTTGAMVAAQPFSGARLSGTNSKVGGIDNLRQWIERRTIGLTLVKPTDFAPPYLDKE